jgi:branched-subunit amino acid aminotransferase/4-amino-4-deoxychorismate lyase
MSEPLAYLNGRIAPVSQTRLSIFDMGLVHAASVTEMTRTFRQECFRLEEHVRRLFRSLAAVELTIDLSPEGLIDLSQELVEHNARLLPADHELGLVQFVTAGDNPTYVGAAASAARKPSVGVHTFPLPFELWADLYSAGQHLVVPGIRALPPDCLDPRIKSRSRLHWYMADQQVRRDDARASALLADHLGRLTETSSGNFLIIRGKQVITPPLSRTLNGVSQQVIAELCDKLGLMFEQADLYPYDVWNADEACTCSTPYCLLPVTQLNGRPIGTGVPGPVFEQLIETWGDLVGVDIIEQMRSGAAERLAEEAVE